MSVSFCLLDIVMPPRRKRVYVAGPMTLQNLDDNIRRGIEAGIELIVAGYAPLVPHLTHYMEPSGGRFDLETWLQVDLPWVQVADRLVRLAGRSPGADRETALANSLNIPTFNRLEELYEYDQTH
jgi:hypothetical protein